MSAKFIALALLEEEKNLTSYPKDSEILKTLKKKGHNWHKPKVAKQILKELWELRKRQFLDVFPNEISERAVKIAVRFDNLRVSSGC